MRVSSSYEAFLNITDFREAIADFLIKQGVCKVPPGHMNVSTSEDGGALKGIEVSWENYDDGQD
jgi:hypothetical protein